MSDKAPSWKRNLLMLWLSQLLVMAGFSAMIPFVPLFMKNELGIVDEGTLALDVSLFSLCGMLAYAIFCPIWGKLSDRFGTKPMLLRGTFLTAIFFPLMGYVSDAGWLIVLRFLTAACAGTTAASHIMIARTTPEERQGFAQGTLSTGIWAGAMLGNVIGGLVIHWYSHRAAFWVCGILYFIAGFAVLLTREEPRPRAETAAPAARARRRIAPWPLPEFTIPVWTLLALFLAMGVLRNVEPPYVALKVEQMTSADSASYWTGIVSAVVCGGAILAGVLTGWLADRLSPQRMLVPTMLLAAAAMWLQGFAGSLVVFTAARVLMAGAAGGIPPILQKTLAKLTPKRKRGASFGFSTLANCVGGMLAAGVGGASAAWFRLDGVFYVAAALFLLAVPLFAWLLDRALEPRCFRMGRWRGR